ncbi:hypothetical protein PFAG_02405 [Plasmodium falciparum Santa Lucia]|uniref:Uncharacterized protein n=1 Tax=Plasmodium falciparum Santa Lucia TaxID=478859 RepID=W7FVZ0_PLAFA|nr:hypothetical protein PFAG_02405 [Plasmodium falciparum Santa Lucia]
MFNGCIHFNILDAAFVCGIPSFETTYGIFFVSPYNDSKYIKWHEFESHACKNENVALPQINYNASKGKEDKTILKYVCELELIPWDEKRKLPVHYAEFNDTLISPNEITNYLQGLFQQDNINEEQLKNFFGTDNYEQIYYVILNNLKNQKQMMNITPM